MTDDLQMIKNMVNIFSISGQEQKMTDYLSDKIARFGNPSFFIDRDKFNNLSVVVPGQTDEIILLDAHMDQIGFVVSGISDKGMLVCYRIGGCSLASVEAREFVVLTKEKNIPCVANKKHMHIVLDEKKELPEKTYDIEFDIGCKTKEEAEKLVEIGDYVAYKPTFGYLENNLIYGTALDDKIGCFILFKLLETLSELEMTPKKTLVFSFSCQEETGITRFQHLVKKFKPSKILEFDVTFASDYLGSSFEKQVGKCLLGEGLVLYVGNLVDNEIKDKLTYLSKENSIKIQKQVLNGCGGYNSDCVYTLGEEADVSIIGIPLRNMHSPVEICSMDDVYSGVSLISKMLFEE